MSKYILSKKSSLNELATLYSFLIGLLIAFIIGSIILILQGQNPIDVFSLMLKLSVGSFNSISSSLNKAIPLILAGLGIAIINTVKLWNIGAEGQIFLGAIFVNLIYINTDFNSPSIHIIVLLEIVLNYICIYKQFCIINIIKLIRILRKKNKFNNNLIKNYLKIALNYKKKISKSKFTKKIIVYYIIDFNRKFWEKYSAFYVCHFS